MTRQIELSDEERTIVLHLLSEERKDLQVEFRRTIKPELEDELKQRKHLVDDLIKRLGEVEAKA